MIKAGNSQNRKRNEIVKKIVPFTLFWVMMICIFVGVMIVKIQGSPEYALYMTAKDIEDRGIEGIRDHLSDRAMAKYDDIIDKNHCNNGIVGNVLVYVIEGYAKKHLSEVSIKSYEFTKKEVAFAEINLLIEYKGVNITVIIDMVRTDGKWLIDDVSLPNAVKGVAKLFFN